MESIIAMLQWIGAFVGGVFARLGVVLVAMAVLLVPVLLVWGAMRLFGWARRRAQGLQLVAGLRYRPDVSYAEGHTWVGRVKGGARVGIDDLAQRILPWAVSVQLPRPGTVLQANQPAAVISAGGQEAVIRSPMAGTVLAVNANVALDPSLVKSDGYAGGWLFSMKPADERLGGLRSGAEAVAWLERESARLHHFLEGRLGMAAADGGELVDPVASHLTPQEWKELTGAFLR
jgi:glycine cleavage system H lipoate-binding protein